MSFPFITFWSCAEVGDIIVWSLAWDALQMALSCCAKRLQQWGLAALCRSGCSGLWVCSLASAELHVSLCPSCAIGWMFLVFHSRGAINNLKPNGTDGNAPFGLAGPRLQADFRLHVFLIYVFGKCLCYWGGGLWITRPGFIQRCKTNFESDISPFLGSTGPVLKTRWMLFPCCSAEELPKLRPYSPLLEIFQTRSNDWCLVNCPVAQT